MPAQHATWKVAAARRLAAALVAVLLAPPGAWAQTPASTPKTPEPAAEAMARNPPPFTSSAKDIGRQVRAALDAGVARDQELTIGPPAQARKAMADSSKSAAGSSGKPANPKASRQYIRAKAAALAAKQELVEEILEPAMAAADTHWSYEGATGPQAWGKLHPDNATCALGRQQSPINIDESTTLRGPAEAIVFDYRTSSATVVNNGHTVQVDIAGDNGMFVRGSRFHLLQVHFHHPSEEQVNYRRFAMVAHMVHRDHLGQLAVVAVLLEPGAANAVINNFWTYMPLGKGDRVPMPRASVELAGLLPKDQRYYQFMGSLTTPPCTEGVLWIVLKQPVTISHEQLRLFAQQFPNNARPVQPTNGRVVRDAQ